MKNGKKFLTFCLSFILMIGMNATAFGAESETYKLYKQASRAQSSASYRYSGTLSTDMTVTVGEENATRKEYITIDAMGTGKGNSYATSTGEVDGVRITTESLLQDGTLYARSFKEGTERPKWTAASAVSMLEGDMISHFQEYADDKDASGLTYFLGKSKSINNIEHTQVVIVMDDSFIQRTMSPMTDAITETIISSMSVQLDNQEKAYMTALISELYKNMSADMQVGCFINPRTSLFHSMTMDGLIKMNWLGMDISAKISGEFIFDYSPVTLPVIKDEDIAG